VLQGAQETTDLNVVPGVPWLDDPGRRVRFLGEVDLLTLDKATQIRILNLYWVSQQAVDRVLVNGFATTRIACYELLVGVLHP
jgi:hypothetical protein